MVKAQGILEKDGKMLRRVAGGQAHELGEDGRAGEAQKTGRCLVNWKEISVSQAR